MSTNDEHDARFARSRALIVGVGGLGAPAAMALAAAGVGTLVLVDPDVVELSNLHRQPLYETADIGRAKVDVAASRLHGSKVVTYRARFAPEHLAACDVALDGTDSIAAKFLVNDACVDAGVPLVHAGVLGFRAQLLTVLPGRSACYRCLFEEAPPPGDVPSCQEAGVLGPVPSVAGALQAAEALRVLAGVEAQHADRLLTFDLHAGRWRVVPVAARSSCPACARLHVLGRSEAS